jgi:hypothetical protein
VCCPPSPAARPRSGPLPRVLAGRILTGMELRFIEQQPVYNPSADRLRFFATHKGLSLMFTLSRKVLDELEGAVRVPETKLVTAFERHKMQIRAAAARAYRAAGATRGGIAVNLEHMAR